MEASFHTGFLFAFYFKVLSSIPYLLVNPTGPPPVGSTSGSLVSHGLFICILFQSVVYVLMMSISYWSIRPGWGR